MKMNPFLTINHKVCSFLFILLAPCLVVAKPQVFTQKLEKTKVSQTLLFPALVRSRVESNIRSDADLIVIRSYVSLGQRVKKGDVLLELRNQDTSMNFHNRQLRAPVPGVVAALMVQTGEYVQKGQDLALINDPFKLFLKLEMPVAHHYEVAKGLQADGTANTIGNTRFKAQVSGVGAVLDAVTGTVPVELEFIGTPSGLLPGTITHVELKLKEEEKILLPGSALYYSGDKTFLPLLQNGKVNKIEVKTRPASKGQVEVLDGVKLGSEVIVSSGEFLKSGDLVDIVKKQ